MQQRLASRDVLVQFARQLVRGLIADAHKHPGRSLKPGGFGRGNGAQNREPAAQRSFGCGAFPAERGPTAAGHCQRPVTANSLEQLQQRAGFPQAGVEGAAENAAPHIDLSRCRRRDQVGKGEHLRFAGKRRQRAARCKIGGSLFGDPHMVHSGQQRTLPLIPAGGR